MVLHSVAEPGLSEGDLEAYLVEVRRLVLVEIERIIPRGTPYDAELYDLMRDYPLRDAKGLRPALCHAVCRAFGGHAEAVLPTAAVLELFHNAFLIHDDIEDGSWLRRDRPTLHRAHGVPIAVNVGDAMLALCLEPLLENTRLIGLGKALQLLQLVARMVRESAEGQALELAWIRGATWALRDREYYRMVHKKTTWYSFLAPMVAGALVAGVDERRQGQLRLMASCLGMAFQIQDDLLNLEAAEREYGKEIEGDLWEGKHTLILIATLRHAAPEDRRHATEILARRRPVDAADAGEGVKTAPDVAFLRELIDRHGGAEYARNCAQVRVRQAARRFAALRREMPPSVHSEFIAGLIQYVVARVR